MDAMSDNERQPTVALPAPPRRRRWVTALLAAAIFIGGMICGAGLTAVAIHRAAREAIRHPEVRAVRASKFLARRLSLTAEQQAQVLLIVERQQADLAALRGRIWPEVVTRLRKTEDEIAAVLTPKQQEEWRKTAAKLRENWMPAEMEGARGPGAQPAPAR